MTETDSSEINKFILKAVLNKEPVFDSYKKFCEIRGNQDTDYVDFEFKYYQFYHGNQEERSPLKISDLPMDVLEKVVGKLLLVDRLILRKVSHDFRNLVDSSEAHCETIYFEFGPYITKIESENVEIYYQQMDDANWTITSSRIGTKINKVREHRNFKQAMLADAGAMLMNPKLRIGNMKFQALDDDSITQFLELLKSLNFQLNLRSILMSRSKWILPLLQFLNPDKLEEIQSVTIDDVNEFVKSNSTVLKNPKLKFGRIALDVFSDELLAKLFEILKSPDLYLNFQVIWIIDERWIDPTLRSLDLEIVEAVVFDQVPFTADQFNEICGMEEWKKKTRLLNCDIPNIGIEHFFGFQAFQTNQFTINDENLVKIRDTLLKSPHFKVCSLIEFRLDRSDEEVYEQLDRIMSQSPLYDVETRRMSIPNSRDYFQLSCEPNVMLTIIKVSED